jgi:hypothetical protein
LGMGIGLPPEVPSDSQIMPKWPGFENCAVGAYLRDSTVRAELPPLPVMRGGGELVDVADRKALDALYD